jgi:hypothetical protein
MKLGYTNQEKFLLVILVHDNTLFCSLLEFAKNKQSAILHAHKKIDNSTHTGILFNTSLICDTVKQMLTNHNVTAITCTIILASTPHILEEQCITSNKATIERPAPKQPLKRSTWAWYQTILFQEEGLYGIYTATVFLPFLTQILLILSSLHISTPIITSQTMLLFWLHYVLNKSKIDITRVKEYCMQNTIHISEFLTPDSIPQFIFIPQLYPESADITELIMHTLCSTVALHTYTGQKHEIY